MRNPNPYKRAVPSYSMRLWKLAAFAILVAALGHLIYVFQEIEPSAPETSETKPFRHIMLEADYFPILCDILIVVILVGGIASGARRRKKPQVPEEEYSWWMLMLMRIGVLALFTFLYFLVMRRRILDGDFLQPFKALQGLGQQQQAPEFVLSKPTAFEQYIVVLLSVLVIVIIAVIIVSMIRPGGKEEEPFLIAFPEYILKKREYTFDGDPRDVVINAYGAALQALIKKGIPVPEHLTPWEFQKQVGSSHLLKLTQLFEKARYSTHNISQKDSEEALKRFRLIEAEEFDTRGPPRNMG